MMRSDPLSSIVAVVAALALSSASRLKTSVTNAKGNRMSMAPEASMTGQIFGCDWVGHKSNGVRLRFPLEADDMEKCNFACQRTEKYAGFHRRFVNAFTKNFAEDADDRERCQCIVNTERGPKTVFTFASSKAHCTPEMCWKVYVKYADLGAKSNERVGVLDNYAGECMECDGDECSWSAFKRIGLSADQKEEVFIAAAAGDIDAQKVKELIEEFDVEPGPSVSPLSPEEDEGLPATPRVIDFEQDPTEFIEDDRRSNASFGSAFTTHNRAGVVKEFDATEAECAALIVSEVMKISSRLGVFESSDCGIESQGLLDQYEAGDRDLALPPEAHNNICKETCRDHAVLREALSIGVPSHCEETAMFGILEKMEAVYNVFMAVWTKCGRDELKPTSSNSEKIPTMAELVAKMATPKIVGEDNGCTRVVEETSVKDGQIGDTCTLHSVSRINFGFHEWVRTSSTCGNVVALESYKFYSASHVEPEEEKVTLRCYKPDGTDGEMPEPGEQGICAIPKRKPCGRLECPCRPGSHCQQYLDMTPWLTNGTISFAAVRFQCTSAD